MCKCMHIRMYGCNVSCSFSGIYTSKDMRNKWMCGVQTLTVCVECILYVNVLRVLVLSYA